jgi:DNA polymerase III delta prime subunit
MISQNVLLKIKIIIIKMDNLINSFFLNTLAFDEYLHSKKTLNILKNISDIKNGLNIILHGNDGTGKTSIMKTFIDNYYEKKNLKINEYEYKHNSKKYSFIYYQNFFIKVFDFRLIQYHEYLVELFNDIKNINSIPMYIFFKHSELMDSKLASSLRPCIEKLNQKNIFFFFTTSKIYNFIEPIKSRCIILNLEYIKQKDISEIFKKLNIQLTKYYEKKLYNEFYPNIKNIILNGISYKIFDTKLKTISFEKLIETILKKIKKNEKNLLENLNITLYEIIKKNNVDKFIEDFLKYLLEKEEYKKKEEYIELFSNIDTKLVNCTNPIYVLQYMILELKDII